MAKTTPIKKHRAYGLFAIAAAIYTLGVVAFSTWSYFEHRAILLAHIDESLINATHATEQIIGRIFIECAVEFETVHEPGHAANQAELDRFAEACRFDAIGAIAIKGTNLWPLVVGIDRNGTHHPAKALFQSPIQSGELAAILRSVATPGNDRVRMQSLRHEKYGSLRVAVRYEPIGAQSGYALVVARNIGYMDGLMRAQVFHKIANGLFLLAMAYPLIALYNRARAKSSKQLATLNERLQQDVEIQRKREVELKDAIHDLERFNAVAVGREGRIIELKAEVNTLLEQANRTKRYKGDHIE